MSRFFIERPVFAWVIAIIIMLIGIIAIFRLPIEQYPSIAPPSVSINAIYPGASAKTLEDSVTQIIEQSLVGIDNMRYFSSTSDSSGMVTVTVTFEPGTNPDIAQVQVQNKIQAVLPLLPSSVQQQGIVVAKANKNFLLVAGFYSEKGNVSQHELGDILNSTIKDNISRINGVGSIIVFGEENSMRIWLDPHKLISYQLAVNDIINALNAQNVDVSAGQIGGLPSIKGQQINATVNVASLLQTVTDFEKIILRVNQNGSQLRLKDVARVELGSQSYDRIIRYKRKPAAGIAVSLAAGANALTAAAAVKDRLKEMQPILPPDVKITYPYDTTPFIKFSIKEVVRTLFEAIALVFIVMYLFLQNFRTTLIPTIAVPVVLLGTFGILSIAGFSINILTLFAMVLSIGLLVDDAIVVVENVERLIHEKGLSPKEATYQSMEEITGALIGIAVVLSAVFIPMAFFSGSSGAIYRQFSITLVSAMGLSVLVALILSPTLCATLLKPTSKKDKNSEGIVDVFFAKFNAIFNKGRDQFVKSVDYILYRIRRFIVIYVVLIIGLIFIFSSLPSSFIPDEDQGTMFFMTTMPPGTTSERTLENVKKIEDYILDKEGNSVEHLFTVTGFSFAGIAQNVALGFIGLKPWEERKSKAQSVFSLVGRCMMAFSQIKDSMTFAFYPPPIQELGNASGFDMQLVDRGGLGHEKLMQARNQLLYLASQNPKLQGVRPNGLGDVAQYKINIDNEKASAFGINIADINQTLQTAWGSAYINDFIDKGRTKKVYLQADADYRMMPEDLHLWYVRNNSGKMVPFDSFISSNWEYGSPRLERFNGISSVEIQGSAAPGVSTGEAMQIMESLVKQLPAGLGVDWVGTSYEERASGAQAPVLYAISVIVIFLCLAALYESWTVPFAVMLSIPLGMIGTVLAVKIMSLNDDIYFQIGLLTTMGLASKNAILIIEFAKNLCKEGYSPQKASLIAAQQRFRPIIMTSMAFVLGVVPLAIASGAGSASQNSIGISVIGGMMASTFIVIFFVPMFYVAIELFSNSLKKIKHEENK